MQTPDYALPSANDIQIIRMPVASRGVRLLNLIVDSIIITLIEMVFLYILKQATDDDRYSPFGFFFDQERPYWQSILFQLPFTIFYYTPFEVLLGRTPGKMMTQCRVVNREDGGPITWSQGLLRSLVRLFSLEALMYIFTPTGLHDLAGKSLVIDERPASNLE